MRVVGFYPLELWNSWNVDQMGKRAITWLIGPQPQAVNSCFQIDTSNITNAFVSGMKEDLDLYQNQYNYIVVSWTVGYIIGQWVSSCFL